MSTPAVIIPPIKSQGIKTKLVPWIADVVQRSGADLASAGWIEPFFGTGVVGFNAPVGGRRVVGDSNPHIIRFYSALRDGSIAAKTMHEYLSREGALLRSADGEGYAHYREVKARFNASHAPCDFIFLSRAGFNGMMRFNRQGEWNIPFCKKPERFAPAYITKICNQTAAVARVLRRYDWCLRNQDFVATIAEATSADIIYCDPPYYGRYADYYNGWSEADERRLFEALLTTPARFILSTWHHNEFRRNEMIDRYWGRFNIVTREHFYHSGAHIENRHAMVEALVCNFTLQETSALSAACEERQLTFDFAV